MIARIARNTRQSIQIRTIIVDVDKVDRVTMAAVLFPWLQIVHTKKCFYDS